MREDSPGVILAPNITVSRLLWCPKSSYLTAARKKRKHVMKSSNIHRILMKIGPPGPPFNVDSIFDAQNIDLYV